MKKSSALLLLVALAVCSVAQKNKDADSVTYLLHKFARNIGKETYRVTDTDSGYRYDINFRFVDRGAPVPLKASMDVNRNGEATQLLIKGSTSRFSTIKDSIGVRSQTAYLKVDDSSYTQKIVSPSFLIAGYSPGTVQMLLLQYWEKHGRPEVIHTLPSGSLRIKKEGTDELSVDNKKLKLQRFIVSGLIWGNEIIWTDEQGKLICLITNDAEGDKLEMMLEPYESLLPELIARAATYSMRLFRESIGKKTSAKNNIVAITGGNVLNVENGSWTNNAVVLVENGKIIKVGPKASVNIPSNARVIDATGKSILPGLWDMHSHFQQAEWGPAYLASGVTTVRDVGNEFEYINAIQQAIDGGQGIGPHILKAGIIDGDGPTALGVINANTKEEAIAAVRKYKQNGFVQIKIYSSTKPPVVKAICDEAHRLGLTVTGHIPEGMNILQGIDSGMDAVNHLQYVYRVLKKTTSGEIDWSDSANSEILSRLQQSKVVIDPTIGVYEMVFRSLDEDITTMEPAFSTLPLPLQSLFEHMGSPADRARTLKPRFNALSALVKVLHDKGVIIVAGTDMGFPGYSLFRELELYVAAGLSPLDAIKTATIVPAKVMNVDATSGSVAERKNADLIIIDGNPLENIRNIRNVKLVMKDGVVYEPAELHKLAGFNIK
jgi:imidazolonepropionase-like amidohydrolase